MTILNSLFCIAFLAFAYLNLNDKDSWLWVPIYVAPSVCCGLAIFGFSFKITYLVLTAGYLIYAIVLFFVRDGVKDWIIKYNRAGIAGTMKATQPYIEKTREFFGLLIVSGALIINYIAAS